MLLRVTPIGAAVQLGASLLLIRLPVPLSPNHYLTNHSSIQSPSVPALSIPSPPSTLPCTLCAAAISRTATLDYHLCDIYRLMTRIVSLSLPRPPSQPLIPFQPSLHCPAPTIPRSFTPHPSFPCVSRNPLALSFAVPSSRELSIALHTGIRTELVTTTPPQQHSPSPNHRPPTTALPRPSKCY